MVLLFYPSLIKTRYRMGERFRIIYAETGNGLFGQEALPFKVPPICIPIFFPLGRKVEPG